VGWWGDEDRSDVKSICGTHPAVYGWDLGDIGADANLDGVSFDHMRELIQNAYRLGGVSTISWHMDNLVTGGDSWDLTPAVAAIIPDGSHHADFLAKLDIVADFMSRCRGDDDELIPVIFRPFHEHTGSWFWWGADHCTEGDYIELFQFTVEYLREDKGLGHLLFAFSPFAIGIGTEADYLTRYPGDDYIDVMGVDYYYGDAGEFDGADQLVRVAGIAVRAAEQRGKVAAITEFGIQDGLSNPDVNVDNWYTEDFLRPILRDPTARRAAYALTWRNANTSHFFVPYPGHLAEPDFRRVCDDPFVVMQEDLPL
jgi:mannan endo-1,4-beta-mannosidase